MDGEKTTTARRINDELLFGKNPPTLEQDCLRQAAEAIHVPASYAFALQSDAKDNGQTVAWGRRAHEGYTLAMYGGPGLCCDDLRQKVHWLTTAAEEGDLRAMYLLAFECDDPGQHRRWLQMAAGKGYVPAM